MHHDPDNGHDHRAFEPSRDGGGSWNDLGEQVGKKEQRRLEARRQRSRSIWFGFGMFGIVGWSIAVPTVAAIFLGVWIDRTWRPPFSCTLTFVFVGVVVGCWIAWYWINRELADDQEM